MLSQEGLDFLWIGPKIRVLGPIHLQVLRQDNEGKKNYHPIVAIPKIPGLRIRSAKLCQMAPR